MNEEKFKIAGSGIELACNEKKSKYHIVCEVTDNSEDIPYDDKKLKKFEVKIIDVV